MALSRGLGALRHTKPAVLGQGPLVCGHSGGPAGGQSQSSLVADTAHGAAGRAYPTGGNRLYSGTTGVP